MLHPSCLESLTKGGKIELISILSLDPTGTGTFCSITLVVSRPDGTALVLNLCNKLQYLEYIDCSVIDKWTMSRNRDESNATTIKPEQSH